MEPLCFIRKRIKKAPEIHLLRGREKPGELSPCPKIAKAAVPGGEACAELVEATPPRA
jgi:hypothetical protein